MRILYLGCHEILEWQDMRLFTEMKAPFDIEIFSLLGAYMNPLQSGGFMRSVVPHGRFYPNLYSTALQSDKDNIHPELIEWADIILMTHNSAIPGQKEKQSWLVRNWDKFMKAKKRVIWRSIGQSTPEIEKELKEYREKGLKIVRYSPIESYMENYAGGDAMIRFDCDEEEYNGWNGEKEQIITFVQSFKKRGDHVGFPAFEKVTDGFNRKVYGRENEDLNEMWGGMRSFSELKQNMREARVYFYFGTVPAPYTLSLMEAMMTGIPVVAVGRKLRELSPYNWPNYEVPDFIENGVNGYCSDDINELRGYVKLLLGDHDVAKRIGEAGRKTAIQLFSKNKITEEWLAFLKTI